MAAHEHVPLVLRDLAPGLPKKGPPWDIEGEPDGPKFFALKRPFEAENEGDAVGHTGHHQKKPGHIKVLSAPQISKNYAPWARTCHCDVALKLPDIVILRPIERACSWRRRRQRVATSTQPTHHAHITHTTCATQCLTCQPHPKLGTSNKAKFAPIAWNMHFTSVP